MRTLLALVTLVVLTLVFGTIVVIAGLLGVRDRGGSVFDRMPRWWAKGLVHAGGVRIVIHGGEHARGPQHIFIGNHVAWYDVVVLASLLSRAKFVAKAELAKIPLFGRAVRSAGMVFIERENRKSAFESYREAAARIHEGASVVVFAEGTRGSAYPLRPFKKGPFVLAIGAQAPIVPTVIHGTIEVQPRGRLWITPGRVDVHFLEPVPTRGLSYDDRDALATTVRDRMCAVLRDQYGVESPHWDPRRTG